jgi:hypothetical protein
MTYLTMCRIEHLIKMYLKMNILVKMTFDLVKSDKGVFILCNYPRGLIGQKR